MADIARAAPCWARPPDPAPFSARISPAKSSTEDGLNLFIAGLPGPSPRPSPSRLKPIAPSWTMEPTQPGNEAGASGWAAFAGALVDEPSKPAQR